MARGEADAAPACILVVDDSPTIRSLVRALLSEQGYRVLEARDGAEAARVYCERAGEIDAVLLDEEMPVMGGHEAARLLLKIDPAARLVCMSGGPGAALAADGGTFGFKGFVRKPFKVADPWPRWSGSSGRRAPEAAGRPLP